MINSRNITDLDIPTSKACLAFVKICKARGIDVIITSTFRDFESQNALYAQGRSTPGHIVTNAKGGDSYHNYKVAFDFVPVVNGKAQWGDIGLFRKCGEIGKSLGLEWAGDWHSFKEYAHLQLTGGKTLKDFKAAQHGGLL